MLLSKILPATVAALLVAENTFADACGLFGCKNPIQDGGGTPMDNITNTIKQLLGLVSLIAVVYVLWAGFQMMTAGGDEEKVKTGRKTIIYVLTGIVVMWLAYWIVTLVLTTLA